MRAYTGQRSLTRVSSMGGQEIRFNCPLTGEFEVLAMAIRCTCLGTFLIASDLAQMVRVILENLFF